MVNRVSSTVEVTLSILAGGLAIALSGCEPPIDDQPSAPFWMQADACLVQGTGTGDVHVAVAGKSFTVWVDSPAVQILLSPGVAPRIDVRSNYVSFSGDGSDFPLHTARRVSAQSGLVELAAGTQIRSATLEGDDVVLEAEPEPGTRILGVRARCDDLAAGDDSVGFVPLPSPSDNDAEKALGMAASDSVSVHALPAGARSVSIAGGGLGYIDFALGPPQEGWRFLQWHTPAVVIRGWVRNDDVEELREGWVSSSHGFVSTGIGCGAAFWDLNVVERRTLPAGTRLFAGPGLAAWATVHNSVEVVVERQSTAGLARVHFLPGLSVHRDHVWVRPPP